MDGKVNMNELLKACNMSFFIHSDINQHIPTLYFLASQCNHITELGVRTGVSSTAFLYSQAMVKSYDILLTAEAKALFEMAKQKGRDVELYEQNSLTIENFEETDLLFIDTLHTYSQLIQELNLYHKKVRKFIVLHDTELFGETAEDQTLGLKYAINEFLDNNRDWAIGMHFTNNNGLTVLIRQ